MDQVLGMETRWFAVVLSVWLNILQRKISRSLEGGARHPLSGRRPSQPARGQRRAWAQGQLSPSRD